MSAVIRSYSGLSGKTLGDLLEARKAEVDAVMGAVPGLVTYTILRSDDGVSTITVCNDKQGADESVKVARDWIAKNSGGLAGMVAAVAGATGLATPRITEGPVLLQLRKG